MTPRKKAKENPVIKEQDIEATIEAEEPAPVKAAKQKKSPKKKKTESKAEAEPESADIKSETEDTKVATPSKRKKTTKAKSASGSDTETKPRVKRPRKPKVTEPEEPFKMRNTSVKMLIGAHVSMAKAIANSITNANQIGANSFALFLKNQRKWVSPDMKPEDVSDFHARLKGYNYDPQKHILPHGSYLINLANDDAEKQGQAYECFLDDLKRCEQLNIGRYNFHPGSTASCTREKGIQNVATNINKAIAETKNVKIVIENMAGHGNIIGGPFEELASIIDQVEDKSRVGVCLDTCHLFAAGHDLRTQEAYDTLMTNFDTIVGLKYLAGMHLNDSKADLGANKDLHQNIGQGYIGLEGFRCLMNDKRLEGLPLVLETPCEDLQKVEDKKVWAKEIELLEWLIGKSHDDPEVITKHKELQDLGAADREKALQAAQKKAIRIEKENTPKKKRGKKVKEESDHSSS